MTSRELKAVEIKAFVPAQDFALSMRFYQSIGFSVAWSSDALAEFRHGDTSFLLQNFFIKEHAHNFQMHFLVKSADDWHSRFKSLRIAEEFGVAIDEPQDRPWGMRDFTLSDPSGVLWRIGHRLGAP
jgi:uncharacterized glyoxalase superfamily protein PhnB